VTLVAPTEEPAAIQNERYDPAYREAPIMQAPIVLRFAILSAIKWIKLR
jgi:hypothetical protein